jgi:hypothetical protein
MSRFPLQVCTAILALIPIGTGIVTLLGIWDPIYRPLGLPPAPILDSNLRFFGGSSRLSLVGEVRWAPGTPRGRPRAVGR